MPRNRRPANTIGRVALGIAHDTEAFAVESIRRWWQRLGQPCYLIGATTTSSGLKAYCDLDTNSYPKGIKLNDAEMTALNIKRAEFHGA